MSLINPFSRLKSEKILVVGDLLLDIYTIGQAKRISPEAPVAIINVQKEESRPGGAGNTILNIVSLGAEVVAMGRVGNDVAGSTLLNLLSLEKVNLQGIFVDDHFQTPVKNRIIADNQQVVRVDRERNEPLSDEIEAKMIAALPALLKDIKAVAISDYSKGCLTKKLLKCLIDEAKKRQILVIADPKGIDFKKYKNVFLLKPNLAEAYAAANLPPQSCSLDDVATKILADTEAEYLMITRSEHGISLFCKKGTRQDFPVRGKEVKDVTGAGDTVLAMITCALASGLQVVEAVPLSNIAAGIAIEHIGCARVELADIAKRLLHNDSDNKVFDEKHLGILKFALKGRESVSLSLANDHMSKELILAMNSLKTSNNHSLVISLESQEPQESFIQMLTSLYQVDFIVLNPDKRQLIQTLGCKTSFAFSDCSLHQI